MVQTVSLQLPVDGNSIPQVTSGPIWKISKNIFMVWPREPSYGCSKWFWEGDPYYWIWSGPELDNIKWWQIVQRLNCFSEFGTKMDIEVVCVVVIVKNCLKFLNIFIDIRNFDEQMKLTSQMSLVMTVFSLFIKKIFLSLYFTFTRVIICSKIQ